MQKFTLLNNVIPVDHLYCNETETITLLDKEVVIACALVNINDGVVPFD